MANTYTSLHYHFIFSTKHRQPWIRPEIEERIWEYLGRIARQNKMKPLKTGGIDDHIHMLLGAPLAVTSIWEDGFFLGAASCQMALAARG